MRVIFGNFDADQTHIESLDLELIVGSIDINNCHNLRHVILKNTKGYIGVTDCDKLVYADLDNAIHEISISYCNKLQRLTTGFAEQNVIIANCEILESACIGDVDNDLRFSRCPKLLLNNVSSIHGPSHRIKVGNQLKTRVSELAKNSDGEILTKFEVLPDNIY